MHLQRNRPLMHWCRYREIAERVVVTDNCHVRMSAHRWLVWFNPQPRKPLKVTS